MVLASAGFFAVAGPAWADDDAKPADDKASDTKSDAPAKEDSNSFLIHDGDSPVVFLGDDLMAQRLYTEMIEAYVLDRYPKWHVTFRNVGWPGDTSWLARRTDDFNAGLQRDVLSFKPALVIIQFGMNDARDENNYDRYLDSLSQIVQLVKAYGARVILLSPAPEERYDANTPAGSAYNTRLQEFTKGTADLAQRLQVPFIDLLNPQINFIETGRKLGVLGTTGNGSPMRLSADAGRLNQSGAVLLASTMLKGMGAVPFESSAELDAAGGVVAASGCTITDNKLDHAILKFTRLDDIDPWPVAIDPVLAKMITQAKVNPFDGLDSHLLKIDHLQQGSYSLYVDGRTAGVFTAQQLSDGVMLNTLTGNNPTIQGTKLAQTISAKNGIFNRLWLQVVAYKVPDWLVTPDLETRRAQEVARLEKDVEGKEAEIDLLRDPQPRHYVLVPYR